MKKELIELHVNGRPHEVAVEPSALLLDVLRQELQLTGSKRGCDDSSCGACTVLMDGVAMMSCTMLAASCEGREITTIEGVAEHGALAAVQKAYGDWGGAQCGYCTPGFIMTVKSLLAENPEPSETDVRAALSSNLCRCTGYSQMYEAIRSAIRAEHSETVLPEWKRIFEPDSRCLLDIWTFETDQSHWQLLLDWLQKNYNIAYSEDRVPRALPSFTEIWQRRKTSTQLLAINLEGFTINTHFFSSDEIEMDVLPEEIDSEKKAQSVFEFVSGIAALLNKEVILAPEYGSADQAQLRAIAFCTVDPSGRISLGKVGREIFR
jgi:aerobic-type carbon monoxide dehydrogenase small subunit (CoxS/CutS family)